MKDVKTTVRRRQDDSDTPVHHHHRHQQQPSWRGDGGVEVTTIGKKLTRDGHRRKEKIRYNGACGYYICYSIFVSIVGLIFLLVLLTLHLARCILAVSDKSIYDCFMSLRLGPDARLQRRANTH